MRSKDFFRDSNVIAFPDGRTRQEFDFSDGARVIIESGADLRHGGQRDLTVEAAVFLLEQAKFRVLSMMKDVG